MEHILRKQDETDMIPNREFFSWFTLYFIILLSACGKVESNKDRPVEVLTDSDKPEVEQPPNAIEEDVNTQEKILEIDINIAKFLVEDINEEEPNFNIEHYDSYFQNRELYVSIIHDRFNLDISKDSIQLILDGFLNNVIVRSRNVVVSDYGEFNSIEGRLFDFLYMVQDSSVNRLLTQIRNNPDADSLEIMSLKNNYPFLIYD